MEKMYLKLEYILMLDKFMEIDLLDNHGKG
jgi:hypothetical protein